MYTHPPNQSLWQRLQAWNPDSPGAAFPFRLKLAHEQRWSSEFAQRAIDEYRRFVYLACTLPQGASPSTAVDKVWHLHLTYTEDYWKHFCPEVLHRELHHHPSRGGPEEGQRHDDWYAATLAAYKAHFGEPPPSDLWPRPAKPIELPEKSRFVTPAHLLLVLVPLLVASMFYGQPNPFLLKGPQFLRFFWCLGAVSLFVLWRALRQTRQWLKENLLRRGADIFEAAYLAGGRNRLSLLLLASLVEEGSLDPLEGTGSYRINRQRLQTSASPLSGTLLLVGETATLASLRYHAAGIAEEVAERFRPLRKELLRRLLLPALWLLPLLAVFAARIFQGVSNGRPIGYLLASGCAIGLLGTFSIIGQRLQASATLLLRTSPGLLPSDTGDFQREIIFSGATALAGWTAFTWLHHEFRHIEDTTGGSGGCGSGGCGGDGGCGGGGCGGGCGGCGGGD